MVAYARDEIVPATDFARNFSSIFKSLATGVKERVAVAKNNKLELVVLPIAEYERMKEAQDLLEHIEIYRIVKEREANDVGIRIGMEEMMKKAGVTDADLQD
jgi:PHD/YefM family antitoxin component YafN of YafNO toxin-antitoxin module